MAGKEFKEGVVSVEEGDGEVIDLGLFDFLKEQREDGEIKQQKAKPEVLVTVINKIDCKNEGEINGFLFNSNDQDDEIEEETEIEKNNEKKTMMNLKDEIENKRHEEQSKNEGEEKEIAIEKDTNVKIERVTMEESTSEMEGSFGERKDKKGFLKRIIERLT